MRFLIRMRDKIPDRVGLKPLEFPTMIVLVGLSLLDLGPRLYHCTKKKADLKMARNGLEFL